MNELQLEWVCNLHDHRKTSQGKWKEIKNSMKHQIGRMWDSKNCRWCQHHKIPILVKVTWLLVLKNQFSLFRTQSRISSCWRTHTHTVKMKLWLKGAKQIVQVVDKGQPFLTGEAMKRLALLEDEDGLSIIVDGFVVIPFTTFAWIAQEYSTRKKIQTTRNRQVISLWKDLGASSSTGLHSKGNE